MDKRDNHIAKWVQSQRTLLFALVNSVCLLFASYFLQNIDIPFNGDETIALKRAIHLTGSTQDYADCESVRWTDSILFINGCYDIETIPHYSSSDLIPDGNYAITNRKDIYKTLVTLKNVGSYRYILLDVALTDLPDGYNEYTDSIVKLLPQMQRIVIAKSGHNFQLAGNMSLDTIARYVDYTINPEESGFSKFNLMNSAPLKIYEDLHKRKLKKRLGGLFYTDNYALCKRTILPSYFLKQDSLFCNSIDWGTQNLFADLNDVAQYGSAAYDFQNKIIVIGDFMLHDIHDTIAGEMSGALILLNVYLNLAHRFHIINWWFVLILLLVYFIFSVLIVKGSVLWTLIPFWRNFWKSEIVQMIFELIGWSFIFRWFSILVYVVSGLVYPPFIAIIWFTVIPKIYVTLISKKELQ